MIHKALLRRFSSHGEDALVRGPRSSKKSDLIMGKGLLPESSDLVIKKVSKDSIQGSAVLQGGKREIYLEQKSPHCLMEKKGGWAFLWS